MSLKNQRHFYYEFVCALIDILIVFQLIDHRLHA
jgi:hypothetical protein